MSKNGVSPLVEVYLAGEKLSEEDRKRRKASVAWYGTCARTNTAVVKEMCAESDDGFKATMWDQERRLWGTLRLANVVSLIASGLWWPAGIPTSYSEEVARAARKIVTAKNQKLRDEKETAERKEAEERERKANEAAEKDAERRRREQQSAELSPADLDFCEREYGLRREIAAVSHTFPFLGPRTSTPLVRVRRWFGFKHNREAGAAAVVARDFEPAFAEYTQNRAEAAAALAGGSASRSAPASKKRKAVAAADIDLDELRKREAKRVDAIKERQKRAKEDPHELAIKAIAERGKSLPPRKQPPFVRSCRVCDVKPIQQFLECGCQGEDSRSWRVCETCNAMWNPKKMPCLCH